MCKQLLIVLVSVFILAGCTSVNIASHKDTQYSSKLSRVLITNNFNSKSAGNATIEIYSKPLMPIMQDLSNKLELRKISASIYEGDPLSKDKALEAAIKTFNPHQILGVNLTKYQYLMRGTFSFDEYTFDVQLFDVSLGRTVWRSGVLVSYQHELFIKIDLGKVVNEIVKKLEVDGLLMADGAKVDLAEKNTN